VTQHICNHTQKPQRVSRSTAEAPVLADTNRAGVKVSELVNLRIVGIDSQRMLIHLYGAKS
jgi:hypothetical protein